MMKDYIIMHIGLIIAELCRLYKKSFDSIKHVHLMQKIVEALLEKEEFLEIFAFLESHNILITYTQNYKHIENYQGLSRKS